MSNDKPMFGANMELLRSKVRRLEKDTRSHPVGSEGEERLVASETCAFSTLPEMLNLEPLFHPENEICQWTDLACYNDSQLHF